MSSLLHHRGRVAALSRSRSPEDPELLDARRSLAAERLAKHIEQIVAQAPPLTNEQREILAAMLAPAGEVGGGRLAG